MITWACQVREKCYPQSCQRAPAPCTASCVCFKTFEVPGVLLQPSLRLIDISKEAGSGLILWVARATARGVTEKNWEDELVTGVVAGSAAEAFRALVSEVFLPLLAAGEAGEEASKPHTADFLQVNTGWCPVTEKQANCHICRAKQRLTIAGCWQIWWAAGGSCCNQYPSQGTATATGSHPGGSRAAACFPGQSSQRCREGSCLQRLLGQLDHPL